MWHLLTSSLFFRPDEFQSRGRFCFLKKERDQGTLRQIRIASLVPVIIIESRHGQVGGYPQK